MHSLDCRAASCPTPLIQTKLWLRQAPKGQSLVIRLSDPGSCRDVPLYLHTQAPSRLEVIRLLHETIVSVRK